MTTRGQDWLLRHMGFDFDGLNDTKAHQRYINMKTKAVTRVEHDAINRAFGKRTKRP
jgi:hypothetical protein